MLNFNKDKSPVRTSIEKSPSPFKPQPAKSTSPQKLPKTRKSIFSFEAFDDSPVKRRDPPRETSADIDRTVQEAQDALDSMVETAIESPTYDQNTVPLPEDYTVQDDQPDEEEDETAITQIQQSSKAHPESDPLQTMTHADTLSSPSINVTSSNQKRKREHPKPLGANLQNSTPKLQLQPDPKRRRSSPVHADSAADVEPTLEDVSYTEHTVEEPTYTEHTLADHTMADHTLADETVYDTTIADQTTVEPTHADQTDVEHTYADQTNLEPTFADSTMADDTMADQTIADEHSELAQQTPRSARGRKLVAVQREEDFTALTAANDEEEDRIIDDDTSSVEDFVPPPEIDQEQDQDEEQPQAQPKKCGRRPITKPRSRKPRPAPERGSSAPINAQRDTNSAEGDAEGKKKGPRSLVTLRAGTPAEDEGAKTTRSGRTSIKPLKYWCNESFVWRNGEVDGVVRASEVPEARQPARRGGKPKKKGALGAIREDEDEEDEDLLPEAWEDELGVINGRVRTWDAEMGLGNPEDEVHEGMFFDLLSSRATF